jgi:CrcB protein
MGGDSLPWEPRADAAVYPACVSPHRRNRHPLHGIVLLAVAVGGAVGATLRHAVTLLGDAGPDAGAGGFPWTTLGINVAGAGLLALLPAAAWVRRRPLLPPLLGTGVLGGFTTLSAWSEETRALVVAGEVSAAGGYAVGTLAGCLAAVALADRFSSRTARAEFDEEEGDL